MACCEVAKHDIRDYAPVNADRTREENHGLGKKRILIS